MEDHEKAKALLEDGIVIKKEDIVAYGVITHVETSNPIQVTSFGGKTATLQGGTLTSIDFSAYNFDIGDFSTADEYYIVRAKKFE